jgi:hypothetical protein
MSVEKYDLAGGYNLDFRRLQDTKDTRIEENHEIRIISKSMF